MPKLECRIVIARPPTVVFAFFADPPRWIEAAPDAPLRAIRPLFSGPVGVGSLYQVSEGTGAETGTAEWEVLEYDPPHTLVMRVPNSSGVVSTWEYQFAAVPGGTQVTHTQEIYLPTEARQLPDFDGDQAIGEIMRTFQDFAWSRMADVMQQATQVYLTRVKQQLEAGAD
jgi:uncharacterized protein YndB with AHSA1/START domain